LILRKISKIGAIRCQILRLKCTKFDFPWGTDPLGELTALFQTQLYLRGLLLRGERKGEEREGEDRGEEGRGGLPLQLGNLDLAVEDGRKGGRTRTGAWVGGPGTFFHFKHWLHLNFQDIIRYT